MHNVRRSKINSHIRNMMHHPIALLIAAFLAVVLGIFVIISQSDNKPISRKQAASYSGNFDRYDTAWKNYRDIYFEDGSCYYIHPDTESSKFRKKMVALEKGTKLYVLVNPNNNCVMEIKTYTEELLNFELSQQKIASYNKGCIALGIFSCISGIFLIIYVICSINYKRKENKCHASDKVIGGNAKLNSAVVRYADTAVKSRILLEARVKDYEIYYRRVKSVNELVINGRVYDEKKGIIEFAHKLYATIDGHIIEAGCDEESYSYIIFDGEIINRKKRLL